MSKRCRQVSVTLALALVLALGMGCISRRPSPDPPETAATVEVTPYVPDISPPGERFVLVFCEDATLSYGQEYRRAARHALADQFLDWVAPGREAVTVYVRTIGNNSYGEGAALLRMELPALPKPAEPPPPVAAPPSPAEPPEGLPPAAPEDADPMRAAAARADQAKQEWSIYEEQIKNSQVFVPGGAVGAIQRAQQARRDWDRWLADVVTVGATNAARRAAFEEAQRQVEQAVEAARAAAQTQAEQLLSLPMQPERGTSDVWGCFAASATHFTDSADRRVIAIASDMEMSGSQNRGGRLEGVTVNVIFFQPQAVAASDQRLRDSWLSELRALGVTDVRFSEVSQPVPHLIGR